MPDIVLSASLLRPPNSHKSPGRRGGSLSSSHRSQNQDLGGFAFETCGKSAMAGRMLRDRTRQRPSGSSLNSQLTHIVDAARPPRWKGRKCGWQWGCLGSQCSAPHSLSEPRSTSHFHLLKTHFSHLSNGHTRAALPGASERAFQTVKDWVSSLAKLLSSLA